MDGLLDGLMNRQVELVRVALSLADLCSNIKIQFYNSLIHSQSHFRTIPTQHWTST